MTKRRLGRAAGLAIGLALLLTPPVLAQADDEDDTGSTSLKTEPATVTQEAYFTAEADGVLPGVIVNEFPPGISCILAPQLCGNTTQPVTQPVGNAVPDPETPDYQAPQPVEEGSLPVGMLGGKSRYTSYLKLQLPDIPAGSIVDRFDLILSETAVSYALESPAFRQAILAGFVTYQTRSPAEFTKFVGDVASMTTPFAEVAPTGIEACAVTGDWKAGASQDATTQPARDCIFGANGERDGDEGTWTFDLSLLVQAWVDGTTPNQGIYLGPLGADNLAFGDPDTSTNWQVSVGGKDAPEDDRPKIRYAISEGFGDDFGLDDEVLPLDEGEFDDAGGFDDVVPSSDPFSVPVDDSALGGVGRSPSIGKGSASGGASGTPSGRTLEGVLAGTSHPRTPWWLWLLLPLGAALAYAYARSFEEDPRAARAGQGALTRLMAATTTDR